ncbi:MAG: NTPase [Desulfurococcaceae archaeon]
MKAHPVRLVITGRPGVGKSTLFNTVVSTLRESNFRVGGIVAPEVREKGVRVGFKVVDLSTGEETWLARRGYVSPVKVGSYGVLVSEADELVQRALKGALEQADVIAVDEVGPMELKLPSFRSLLIRALDSTKPLVLVVHFNLGDRDILSRLEKAWRVVLTLENREQYRKTLPGELLRVLKSAL